MAKLKFVALVLWSTFRSGSSLTSVHCALAFFLPSSTNWATQPWTSYLIDDLPVVIELEGLGELELVDDGRVLLPEAAVVQELGFGHRRHPQDGQRLATVFDLKYKVTSIGSKLHKCRTIILERLSAARWLI